jgi:hypothetical protein
VPIAQGLLHFIHTQGIQKGLEGLVAALQSAGLAASLEKSWGGASSSIEQPRQLQGSDGIWSMLSGTMAVEMEGL